MTHPLIDQLRFTRSEWLRALDGIADDDARRRFEPMNSISWIVGHLAWQEQRYWLTIAQGETPHPELNELVGYGRPASTPPLADMIAVWHEITTTADLWLDSVTTATLAAQIAWRDWPTTNGSLLLRVIYHYWYHIGEIMAIRQQLGQHDLPDFVGDIDTEAPYRAEAS